MKNKSHKLRKSFKTWAMKGQRIMTTTLEKKIRRLKKSKVPVYGRLNSLKSITKFTS